MPSLRLWRALPHVEQSTSELRPPPLTLLLILQALLLAAGAWLGPTRSDCAYPGPAGGGGGRLGQHAYRRYGRCGQPF